jgi:hypothetical protein
LLAFGFLFPGVWSIGEIGEINDPLLSPRSTFLFPDTVLSVLNCIR